MKDLVRMYAPKNKEETLWIEQACSKQSDELYVILMDSGIVYHLQGQECTWKQNPRGYRWELQLRGEGVMYFASVKNAKKWCCYRNSDQNPNWANELI